MIYDADGNMAKPGLRSRCPSCDGELVAKCGHVVTWHWAHRTADCDPWSEPESQWHLAWKQYFRDEMGARVEVVMPPHRADIVTKHGTVIELQSSYLPVDQIMAREKFYGRMDWVYRVHWADRLSWGPKGFRWKHPAKSLTVHKRPVWWDFGQQTLKRVRLWQSGSSVIGKVVDEVWMAPLMIQIDPSEYERAA